MGTILESAYGRRRVFVTGHTGFKGSWLSLWLEGLGAEVTGYALAPSTEPSHYGLLDLKASSVIADIGDMGDGARLEAALEKAQPQIVFHLAAQPIVLHSYEDPVATYRTNVLGTARLLQACRKVASVKAVVVITTDKCYENREWIYGYRENDPLGGHDPYSSSKACTELLTASFRSSFFQDSGALIATARAGNVIGGGDWAEHRLVPDIMRAAAASKPVQVRNPRSSRPWQHVLEPLSGYLALGMELLDGRREMACAWNFGPSLDSNLTTRELCELMQRSWEEIRWEVPPAQEAPHEAGLLMLDSTKAQRELHWRPVWDIEATLRATSEWYRTYYEEQRAISEQQIEEYVTRAAEQGVPWAG